MLILTRKADEAIIIKLPTGEEIDIIVTQVKGSQVRIGVDAPTEVKVWREELLD